MSASFAEFNKGEATIVPSGAARIRLLDGAVHQDSCAVYCCGSQFFATCCILLRETLACWGWPAKRSGSE
jgi:hypothetical protein